MDREKIHVEELLAAGKAVQISPRGYSMYPFLVPGRDQAVLVPAKDELPRRGQVVLYRREGSILVLHRIWKVKEGAYYMVGDNQTEIEGPIGRQQILGVMTAVVKRGREMSVGSPGYRFKSAVWLRLRPFRPFLSHAVASCKLIGGKIVGRRKRM